LKKQHQDIQKNSSQLERSYNDLHEKYQELIAIKLKFEKDIITQQGNIDQEKSAKYMALDKIQELEGLNWFFSRIYLRYGSDKSYLIPTREHMSVVLYFFLFIAKDQ